MTSNRFAVLDLGSNTFHILIVEKKDSDQFVELFRQRVYTKIGKGGGASILDESYQDGIDCLIQFKQYLEEYQVTQSYTAIGTAALRTKENGPHFIADALEKTSKSNDLQTGADKGADRARDRGARDRDGVYIVPLKACRGIASKWKTAKGFI